MRPRRTTLDSGAIAVCETLPAARSVAFGLYFPTGSRHETAETNGVSHFIEHLVFKGTPSRTAQQVNREIDLLGGGCNAYTSKETLCFHARVLPEHLPRLVALFGDLAANALPDGLAHEVDRERDVILSEISAVEDSPEDLVGDLCDRTFFGDHPLALPVVGSAHAVRRLALPDIRAHFARHLVGRHMVVSAAGDVDPDALVALVREELGDIPDGEAAPSPTPPSPRSGTSVETRDLEQVQICLSARGVHRTDPRRLAAEVLSTVLGEGCASRLFREVRDERGLAYSIYSGLAPYADTGSLNVYFGTGPDKLAETCAVVSRVLADVRDGGIRPDELDCAREQIRTSMLLGSDSAGARMAYMAEQALLGSERLDLEAALEAIEAVDLDAVHSLASDLLQAPLAVAAVGPVDPEALPRDGWELPT